MESKSILVIEDNAKNLKLVRVLLSTDHHRVIEAEDAESGLAMARQQRPDLILMDIQLPGMDGLSATRLIKKDPEIGKTPVVALTSFAMAGDEEKALESGCDGYITKPIDTRHFLQRLRPYLEIKDAPHPKTPTTAHRPRVLIVDDDPINVKLLAAKLHSRDFEILQAYDGHTTIDIAQSNPPDLILLDVMMPGLNGYEVTETLKRNAQTRHIPVILITALNGTDDRIRGLEAGAEEFLSKPVNTAELLARVNSMLRLKRYQEQLTLRTESEVDFLAKPSEEEPAPLETLDRPRVLLVEDDPKDLKLIQQLLQDEPYDLLVAGNGTEALELAQNRRIDLILLDILLPGTDGFEVATQLKESEATKDIQIILITSLRDMDSRIKGLETGADDFLVKPINARELRTRVKVLLRQKGYLDRLRAHYSQAVSSAISDGLTGLYNQTFLKKFLHLEMKRSVRFNYPAALLMIDVDDFKRFNDQLGHPAGDCILRELAALIKTNIREIDLAARYGGEEFAVVMPYADGAGAMEAAARLQARIRTHRFFHENSAELGKLTVSMGVAWGPADATCPEVLLKKADSRLYRAKKEGKNRVCISMGTAPSDGQGDGVAEKRPAKDQLN